MRNNSRDLGAVGTDGQQPGDLYASILTQFGDMSGNILGVARTGLLGSLSGGTLQDTLNNSPGIGFLQKFASSWLKLDITTIAAILTIFGMISSALPMLQSGAVRVYWWITRFFTASISVAANDRLNREILNWLGAEVLPRQATRILTARSEILDSDAWHYRRVQRKRDDVTFEKRAPIEYLPTFGTTWFLYERNVFIVRRIPTAMTSSNRFGDVPDEFAAAPEGDEPLVIMCLGRSVEPIKRFLDMVRGFADKQRDAYITVRACKEKYGEHSWDTTILRPLRPLETVHFDQQAKADLVADIENYLDPATRRFYQARGIPYRRGYLLHGPPGTGKTSLSLALAGRFGLELYLLHIPSIRNDTDLETLFTVLPPRCFILLEDIDAVGIKKRVGSDGDKDGEDNDSDSDSSSSSRRYGHSRCTLSGLLNVLDGVASQEGRIVLMTSNFADKLDHALVRPGRIDKMFLLGNISPKSAENMFLRMFLPDSEHGSKYSAPAAGADRDTLEKLAPLFAEAIPPETLTPAQLQGYLLSHRDEPKRAVDCVKDWVAQEQERMEEARVRTQKAAAAKKRRKQRMAAKMAENAAKMALMNPNLASPPLPPAARDRKSGKARKEEESSQSGKESSGKSESDASGKKTGASTPATIPDAQFEVIEAEPKMDAAEDEADDES
jgi:mitochondrial chaperone BCS1